MSDAVGIQQRSGTRRGALLIAAALALAAVAAPLGVQLARGAEGDTEAVTVWDYRTVFVVWDDEAQDWRADWTDGPSTVGLEAVLDAEGAVGWELVELAHERFEPVGTDDPTTQEARRLRLILKREAAPVAAADPQVSISGFSFQPASLEVAAGTTVRWQNDDPAPHTATASDGTFDSGTISAGDSFTFTFDTAGTYDYACAIHPAMVGTVVVS